MAKERKLITLSREVMDDIEKRSKEEDFNFSDWVETAYIKENLIEKGLKIQADFHKNQAKIVENRLTYLKRKRKNDLKLYKKNLNKHQKKELETTKEIIKKRPELLNGRLRLWNNETRRDCPMGDFPIVTKSEFLSLLGLQ